MRTASKLTADVPSDDTNTGIGRVGIEMLAAASLSRAQVPPVKIRDQSVKGMQGSRGFTTALVNCSTWV